MCLDKAYHKLHVQFGHVRICDVHVRMMCVGNIMLNGTIRNVMLRDEYSIELLINPGSEQRSPYRAEHTQQSAVMEVSLMMEVSRPDFMGLCLVSVSVSSRSRLSKASVSRFKGLGIARDYSMETTRPGENK